MQIPWPTTSNANLALLDLCSTNKNHSLVASNISDLHDIELYKSNYQALFVSNNIPMPTSKVFSTTKELASNLPSTYPYVVKADGLMSSDVKTVIVRSLSNLKELYKLNWSKETSNKLVLQEFIDGYEYTVIVLMNSVSWVTVGTANDYKKLENGDQGINTNGMGGIFPARRMHKDTDVTVERIVNAIQKKYPDYVGFVSCQFIVDYHTDKLFLLETNSHICDPEFQGICQSLDDSILDRIAECYNNKLISPVKNKEVNAVTVSLIHKDWPNVTHHTDLPTIPAGRFKVYNSAAKPGNALFGHSTITNSGNKSHKILARELYEYLDSIDTSAYRYRTDIGLE